MLAPLKAASVPGAGEPGQSKTWSQRLDRLLAVDVAAGDGPRTSRLCRCPHARRPEAGDGVHLLLMDLHRELNRLQARIASESVDGALGV